MTLTIELPPALERRLREQAEREGLDAGGYIERLVEKQLVSDDPQRPSLWDILNPDEWDRVTQAWIQSLQHPGPVLSDEAISRESIYEERVSAILGGYEHTPAVGGNSLSDEPTDQGSR